MKTGEFLADFLDFGEPGAVPFDAAVVATVTEEPRARAPEYDELVGDLLFDDPGVCGFGVRGFAHAAFCSAFTSSACTIKRCE